VRVFRSGIIVLPGLPVLPEKIQDPMVVRALVDLMDWSAKSTIILGGGEPVLKECYTKIRDLIVETGSDGAQAGYSVRLRLPKNLNEMIDLKWASKGPAGLKNSAGPFDRSDIDRIINTAFAELNAALGFKLYNAAVINGSDSSQQCTRSAIICGASHARRLADLMTARGIMTKYLETVNWRAIPQHIQDQTNKIKSALQEDGFEDAVIILAMVDNAFFLARYVDGSEIPIRRGNEGIYHVDGDLGYAPVDKLKIIYNQVEPLLKNFGDQDKLLLTPLPRYLWAACCKDHEHAPNVYSEGHVVDQLASIDGAFKLWRGMAFRSKISNLKLCNAAHLVADERYWSADPVHPVTEGYNKVLVAILNGIEAMTNKRLSLLEDTSTPEASKRPRAASSGSSAGQHEDTTPAQKRPAWLTSDSNYAHRFEDAGRGRGWRGGGRGGHPWRGRAYPQL
jgi:hypothetical protein